MQSFKDRQGRAWQIEINVALAKKVRALLGVDLYKLVENEFAELQKLLRDPITLVDVIYVLCKDQADALRITDEQFGGSLAGESVTDAANAFFEAFVSFSQDPRMAAVLRSMKQKSLAAVVTLTTDAETALDGITVEMLVEDAKNPGSLARTLKEKSGNSPESSASTPAHLPFAS